ncbi:hypothetical protein, partial [Pseudomonas aeruginosa]|uniref:hypothetical protein n=1 Tax=Pseudomonas aeruginosa TaxID=287 RepID=UPI003005EDB0
NAGAGLLSGWQGLTVTGGSLDNSAGGTLSSKDGELAISLGGALDNHGQGGLVSAQRALSFERDDTLLNNAGGRINGGSLLLKGASLD